MPAPSREDRNVITPHDPRAQQALFMAKGKDKRDQSVRAGILKAVFLISLPIIALIVMWWMFFS